MIQVMCPRLIIPSEVPLHGVRLLCVGGGFFFPGEHAGFLWAMRVHGGYVRNTAWPTVQGGLDGSGSRPSTMMLRKCAPIFEELV